MAQTLAEMLVDAEAAYHDLQLGRSARVFVDQNGERVEYTAANRRDLARYIEELKAKIAGRSVHYGGPLKAVF
jgi:hypothetical protein